jgi:hypothetical protein
VLTLIERVSQTVIESSLANIKRDAGKGGLLRVQYGLGEIDEPFSYVERALIFFEFPVIRLAALFDCVCKRGKARLPDTLRERLFRQRSADPAISLFERMDTFEIEVTNCGPRQSGKGSCAFW